MYFDRSIGFRDIVVKGLTETISVAMLQIKSLSHDSAKALVSDIERFKTFSYDNSPLSSKSKLDEICELLALTKKEYPALNIIILPEYSVILSHSRAKRIQKMCDYLDITVIGGTYIERRGTKFYNRALIAIPGSNPMWQTKAYPSEFESTFIDEKRLGLIKRLVWKHKGQKYWILPYICLDLINYAYVDSKSNGLQGPGIFIVPMSSHNMYTFHFVADNLLRMSKGSATILCNTVGDFGMGKSGIIAMQPGKGQFQPSIELSNDYEQVASFKIELNHLKKDTPTDTGRVAPIRRISIRKIENTAEGIALVDDRPAPKSGVERGILNPLIIDMLNKATRMAFLNSEKYIANLESQDLPPFEILSVVGAQNLVVSDVSEEIEDFVRNLMDSSIADKITISSSSAIAIFKVTEYYKILGVVIDHESSSLEVEPNPEELRSLLNLCMNWDSQRTTKAFRARSERNNWIIGTTHHVPGDITCILCIARSQKSGNDPASNSLFHKNVLQPLILKNESVHTVYKGESNNMGAEFSYVVRLHCSMIELEELQRILHAEANKIGEDIIVKLYVNGRTMSFLKIDEVLVREPLSAADAQWSRRNIAINLIKKDRKIFNKLPQKEKSDFVFCLRQVLFSYIELKNSFPDLIRKEFEYGKFSPDLLKSELAECFFKLFYNHTQKRTATRTKYCAGHRADIRVEELVDTKTMGRIDKIHKMFFNPVRDIVNQIFMTKISIDVLKSIEEGNIQPINKIVFWERVRILSHYSTAEESLADFKSPIRLLLSVQAVDQVLSDPSYQGCDAVMALSPHAFKDSILAHTSFLEHSWNLNND